MLLITYGVLTLRPPCMLFVLPTRQPSVLRDHFLKSAARSAGVTAAAVLHLVQHRSSNIWSNSGQSKGGHTTSRQRTGSALLFIPMPPVMPFAHERSSGTLMSSAQHN